MVLVFNYNSVFLLFHLKRPCFTDVKPKLVTDAVISLSILASVTFSFILFCLLRNIILEQFAVSLG